MASSQHREGKRNALPRRMWQTTAREAVTPYLPPPVVHAIRNQIDPQLEAYGAGPEGTVTVLSTLLFAWATLLVVRALVTRLLTGSGKAVIEDDDAILQSATKTQYDHTVLILGPSGGGKTRLYYQLSLGPGYSQLPTVASIKANVGYAATSNSTTIRYVDWPGYASLDDALLESILAVTDRVILVLDASQPVGLAADVLYFLCAHNNKKKKKKVFVACHKTDLNKAKNWKRIKIQFRTELERLLSVRKNDNAWWLSGKPLELDDLPSVQLHFASTSCERRLPSELIDFCEKGILPESNS